MIDVKFIKKNMNPLNAVVTGIILLFICIRVLSNNQENAFIIEAINPTEIQISSQSLIGDEQAQNSSQTQNSSQAQTAADQTKIESSTESDIQAINKSNATTEPLAYSAELGKTFNLDAFNNLSKDELMTFSGIGEVTAQAILDYRKVNGPFSDFHDLMLIKGIGEKKLQKIMTILP